MNMFRRHLLHICQAAVLAGLSTSSLAQNPVKVEGAWARPTVQGQGGGGGFLKITGGPAADRLLSGSTPVSQSVELHTMKMEGDVMRMRQVNAIDVPARATVELKPGGLHVMFMGLKQPLKTGESFPLTLRFEKAGEVKVDVKVSPTPPAGASAGHGGHGGHKH